MAAYTKGTKGWTPSLFRASGGMNISAHDSGGACLANTLDSIFKRSQVFAMNKYLETGYLSKAEVEKYIHNSVDFTDRPVTFFHFVSSEVPPNGVNALAGGDSYFKVSFKMDPNFKHAVPEGGHVRASLYTVAAQKMELGETAELANVKALDLPWMKDPDFNSSMQKFNREKYPFIWEIGRAASTSPNEFAHLLGMAGQDILKELMHFGVPDAKNIDHAYVSFHALTAENTEKFSKLFPERIIARADHNPSNTVFMVPLKEYLQKFPLTRYSEAHQLMSESLGVGRTVAENQAFIDAVKHMSYVPLDVRYKGKNLKTPIIFSSYPSGGLSAPIEHLAQHYKVKPADFEALLKKTGGNFASQGVTTDAVWPGKLVDPLITHKVPIQEGAVFQMGNLDPVLAKTDPDYVISNIVAMFDHYARQFLPANAGPEMLPQLVNEMKRNKIQFMVTTHYPSTAEAIQKLVPKKKIKIDLTNDAHTRTVWESLIEQSGGKLTRPSNEMQGFTFDLDQIGQFRYFVYMKNQMDPKRLTLIRPGYHWWLQGASEP